MGSSNYTTTLAKNTRFNGVLRFSSSLKIEGYFKGTIESEGFLGIGKEAEVKADIHALSANIEGAVVGDVSVKGKLELSSSASIRGSVRASEIKLKDGMELVGDVQMLRDPGMIDIFSMATDKLKANVQTIS